MAQNILNFIKTAYLYDMFEYDPINGILWDIRKEPPIPHNVATSKGVEVRIAHRLYYAQNIAWALYHGKKAKRVVKFLNSNNADLRIDNLYTPIDNFKLKNIGISYERASRLFTYDNGLIRRNSQKPPKSVSFNQKKYIRICREHIVESRILTQLVKQGNIGCAKRKAQ
jgi:hypothetical protein